MSESAVQIGAGGAPSEDVTPADDGDGDGASADDDDGGSSIIFIIIGIIAAVVVVGGGHVTVRPVEPRKALLVALMKANTPASQVSLKA
ncbi:MAG: hypothetical protein IIA44_11180 [Acidobacteria bacterium]|nr:hypothetical protein [Acidobacteriota bacterium]